jgi:hypothetical protein
MRVIGLLSWFDESPTWLAGTIASFARVCDHIVCVDGRYALYDDVRVQSTSEQHEAIIEAATGAGLGLTLHTRNTVWCDEMEKRTHLFKLGSIEARTFEDWFFVLDADEKLYSIEQGVAGQLKDAALRGVNVASAHMIELTDPAETPEKEVIGQQLPVDYVYQYETPRFWRALQDMEVSQYHFHYTGVDESGERVTLWGHADHVENPEWVRLGDACLIENRCLRRPLKRHEKRTQYYAARDSLHMEVIPKTRKETVAK